MKTKNNQKEELFTLTEVKTYPVKTIEENSLDKIVEQIQYKEYNGLPVITFDDIIKVHQIAKKTVESAYKRVSSKMDNEKDTFILTGEALKTFLEQLPSNQRSAFYTVSLRVFTESGYLNIIKAMDDETFLNVYNKMKETYFKKTAIETQINEVSFITPINIKFQTIDETKQTVLASELYKFLELNSAHYARWYKDKILNNAFATEGIEFSPIMVKTQNSQGGRPTQDFELSIDFAKKLCMTSDSKKGEQIRDYFIEVEKRFKKAKEIINPMSEDEMILLGYSKALEKIKRLETEVVDKQKQIEHDRPDIEFAKTIKKTKEWFNIGQVAKELKFERIGRDRLYKFLADNKYIMAERKVKYKKGKRIEYWDNYEPYQRDVEAGYFKLVATHFTIKDKDCSDLKLVCSQKGADYIRRLLLKHGYQPLS